MFSYKNKNILRWFNVTPVRLNCISALMLVLLKSDLCIFCVTIRAGESKVLQVKPKEGDTENSSVWTNAKSMKSILLTQQWLQIGF